MRKLLRFVCLLLAVTCLCSAATAEEAIRGWDKKDGYVYLTLGTFPQTKEGERLPILWRVLRRVPDHYACLLSEYVLEARRLHGDYKEYANKPTAKKNPGFDGDYTQTELAKYLNGEFMQNFTEGELALIASNDSMGHFFLLSADDLKNPAMGFTSNESRKAWGTEYAIANGLFKYRPVRGSHSPYWTSTQSTSNKQAARCIKSKGEIGYINVITEDEGLRPACYLDMSKVEIVSGSGTKEDPYVLNTDMAPVITEAVPLENPTAE